MIVGVPREVKTAEDRVAITPVGVRELVEAGHDVLIERGAGTGSSIHDEEFEAQGATIVPTAGDVFAGADLILKVKEPQPAEVDMFKPGQVLFTYLHLAAYPDVGRALLEAKTTGIAYETVQLATGALPLLAPMSEVAGRMAPQIGAHFLERAHGGRGVLLGGAPGVRPARVVVMRRSMRLSQTRRDSSVATPPVNAFQCWYTTTSPLMSEPKKKSTVRPSVDE